MFVSASYLCYDSFLLLCCCLLLLLKFLLAIVITVIIVSMGMNQLFLADTFCKQVSNGLQSLFWGELSLAVCFNLSLQVWFLMCKIVSVSIFVHCAHFYFQGANPLHSVMLFCFCKVPHNFQFVDPKLWFFECSKSEIIIHLQEHQFHIYWMTIAKPSLKKHLKNQQTRPLRYPLWMWSCSKK